MVSLPQVHISCYACIILYLYIIILSYELCLWFSVFRVLHHLCTTQCMYDTYMYVHILYMLYDVSLVFYRQSWRHGMATCYRSFASGSGEFGQVFRGFYKDQEVHDHVGACSTRKTWAFGQVCMQVDVHTACSVSVRLTERRCSSNYSSLWINLHILHLRISYRIRQIQTIISVRTFSGRHGYAFGWILLHLMTIPCGGCSQAALLG